MFLAQRPVCRCDESGAVPRTLPASDACGGAAGGGVQQRVRRSRAGIDQREDQAAQGMCPRGRGIFFRTISRSTRRPSTRPSAPRVPGRVWNNSPRGWKLSRRRVGRRRGWKRRFKALAHRTRRQDGGGSSIPRASRASGRSVGPSLYHMLAILDKDKVIARLRASPTLMRAREVYTGCRPARLGARRRRGVQPPLRLAVFGDPVAHSASPPMHDAALGGVGHRRALHPHPRSARRTRGSVAALGGGGIHRRELDDPAQGGSGAVA